MAIFWEELRQDIRYALRRMSKDRAFTLLILVLVALGVGANTAIFSFMDAILLRTLPVHDPASLVILKWHIKGLDGSLKGTVVHKFNGTVEGDPHLGTTSDIFPFSAYELLRERNENDPIISSLFAYSSIARDLNYTLQGQHADVAKGEYVSGNYFSGLAVQPAAGRLIFPDDDKTGADPVAVVSFAFSVKHFGSPQNAVGKSVVLNNVEATVVGVTRPEFFGVTPGISPEFYLPMHESTAVGASDPFGISSDWYIDKNNYWVQMMARLQPGVSRTQAQEALGLAFHQWEESTASNDQERSNLPALVLMQGQSGLDALRRQYSKPLYVLMTLVGLILGIACANIANLLLARARTRAKELALRMSLGAGRWRIVRQLLTESVVMAMAGGALGIAFAAAGIRFLTVLLANGNKDSALHATLNWHVLAMAAALSVFTGVLFGLAPGLQAVHADYMGTIKQGGAGGPRRSWINSGHVLVVCQIALSFAMLVAAGLFVRTLSNLESLDLGFNRDRLLLFRLNARAAGMQKEEIPLFYAELQREFSLLPHVRNVSLSNPSFLGQGSWRAPVSVPGKQPKRTDFMTVGPGFFTTMQVPILVGREINERDVQGTPEVAVVNQQFVKENFPGQNPVGKHFAVVGKMQQHDIEIVGLAKDTRYDELKEDMPPIIFIPYAQGLAPVAGMTFALRSEGDPLAFVDSIREIVRRRAALLPVTDVQTQNGQIEEIIHQETTFSKVCSALALLALVIACIGLYATTSYRVARRTVEIGIRMALGARRYAIIYMILSDVAALVGTGIIAGAVLAFSTSKFIQSFLFGMKSNDPLALIIALATLVICALSAGYFPAQRASRVDPIIALRHD